MKSIIIALSLVSSIGNASAVMADTISEKRGVIITTRTEHHGKQIEKVTCREFLSLQPHFQPQAVSYAIGYTNAQKPEDAVLDVEGLSRFVPVVQKSCRTTPELTLMQRIRADFHKL